MSEKYLAAVDFDNTTANTFEKSPLFKKISLKK
jgi:hypothetical protein